MYISAMLKMFCCLSEEVHSLEAHSLFIYFRPSRAPVGAVASIVCSRTS